MLINAGPQNCTERFPYCSVENVHSKGSSDTKSKKYNDCQYICL